jgi:trans-aconitate methyltransferase
MAPSDPSPSFTWNPADYNKSSPFQHKLAQELIAKLALSGNSRVLDIGCGDGRVTAEIARTVSEGSVTGVDSSPEMIQFARDHFPRREYQNLSFTLIDARELRFSEEFDLVFSNAALHWIPDHRQVLAGIARSLCPGGRMLIQMGGKGNLDQVFGVLGRLVGKPEWRTYFDGFSFTFGFFSDADYRQWLTEAGLDVCRVELIPRDMSYASRQDFAAWIRTTWLPWLARLPECARAEFIEAFIDAYLAKYPADADGTIHIRMVRLEAEARKQRLK